MAGAAAARLRTVFMGTPRFAVPSLAVLAEAADVTLVLCNPDRPAGRGRSMASPPAKEEAVRRGIPVFQPEKARHPDAVARIAAEAPDLIVVVAYGHILPKSILDIPRIGCINVHASLLPKYRGAAPINWAVARGETTTGITIMRMDVGMDTGPMLHVREMPIGGEDTAETLFSKLSTLGAEALREALRKLREGTLEETPQDAALATYAPMLKKEHGRIDWGRPAGEVRNLVRGMTPWPSAFAVHAGKTLKVVSSAVAGESGAAAEPGEIVALGRDGIAVACGEGVLLLQVVQPEGGKAMDAWAYSRGRSVATGERLS
jgi:methionyl-tRNA formyltransferase